MANEKQLEILKSGKEKWNSWRDENFDEKVELERADLSGADLKGADLVGADLRGADLRGADLSSADLDGAFLSGADLYGAYLEGTYLQSASLAEVNLRGANLRFAKLSGAFLDGANLISADLHGANLAETDLQEANLNYANLYNTTLICSNLCGAEIIGTVFKKTSLKYANFEEVNISGTHFADVDLSDVINLDKCNHYGDSFIDYHTLKKSKNLHLNFLRGCGLSEEYIKAIQPLLGQPLNHYSCFISYSMKDEEFVNKLFNDLQENGVRTWYAPKDIKSGQKIHEQIEKAIGDNERLLVILSENSMNSEWVKTEIGEAFKKGKELGVEVLFPVSLLPYEKLRGWKNFDADFGRDLAKEIREYYLPNFEKWKDHDEYKKNFDRLVESLRIEPDINS